MKYSTKRILRAVFCDILLVAAMLCSFAAFHHVIPMMKAQKASREAAEQRETSEAAEDSVTDGETAEEAISSDNGINEAPVVEPTAEPSPEPTPDTRTEWQIRFADKFSDEVESGENYYRSPDVSITVTRVEADLNDYGYGSWPCVYYIADIYVASLENFRTYTADNTLAHYVQQDMGEMDAAANAILSINGDFFSYQTSGFIVRNGVTYIDNSNANSVCVLFNDGTMETYAAKSYDIAELEEKGVFQVWSFGPALLDEDGNAVRNASSTVPAVNQQNPRSAIGYYEPGHYCYVMVEGRSSTSKGMIFAMLADLFEDLGCRCAYNLDGGGSAMICFDHELLSQQSNGDRKLSDILCVVETADIVEGPYTN